ncbi:MAG: DMT family transporter [Alphaproteobacteria bacterium]
MQNEIGRGIALMVLAMGVLAGMDAITKYLATRYDVPQILAIRFWIFLGFAAAMAGPRNVPTLLRSTMPWHQLARSLIIVVEVGVFVLSFRYLPLADVHAITGIAPLLVTALAVPMLGERVGIRRWSAVAVGFVGLLIIIRPGFGELDPYLLIPLGGAFLWALYQVLTRQVSRDAPATSMLYMAGVGAIVMSFIAPFVWVPPTLIDWGALIALGIIGSFGHYLFIRAFQAAPASVLQPFHYTALVWATLIGWTVFGDLPDGWTVAGGLVIAASGIYAILRAEKISRE